ncbi:MAG: RNA polymerase sigma factor RpoH, partial [Alphaproteobacteria bacterium]
MAELVQDYIQSIQKYSALSFEAEQALALKWRDEKCEKAFRTLMQSYLR